MNHRDGFLLEYRDDSAAQHLQTGNVSRAAIADALSQWMRGDRGFVDDHEWQPVVD